MVGESIMIHAIVLFYTTLMLVPYTYAAPQHDEELFLHAQQLYRAGEYSHALATYQSMKQKGPAVFHALGNCSFYTNNPVDALANWHRALQGASRAEFDALQAARAVLIQTTTEKTTTPTSSLRFTIERMCSPYSLLTMQLLFLLFWYLLLFMLWRNKRDIWFWCIISCLCACIVLSGYSVWIKYQEQWYPYAIVRAETTPLLAGPNTNYHQIHTVSLLDELRVYKEIPGWCCVTQRKNGQSGWVQHNDITIVK